MSTKATRDQVETALRSVGVHGECEVTENGDKVVFECKRKGLTVTWWGNTGTVLPQGKNGPLIEKFQQALGNSPKSSDIFVVYGRDEAAKIGLEAILRRGGLNPIILDQCPSKETL